MKNIIGNTCIGAAIYNEQLKTEYQNPFVWSEIDAESMYNLIKHFDDLNFNDNELQKDENWKFSTIIANKVKVKWIHYIFSPKDTVLRIKAHDAFYNRIWEYIQSRYDARTERMLAQKNEPIFIVGSIHKRHHYSEAEIKKICSLKTNYKIIVANNNMDFSNEFPNVIFHKTSLNEKNANNCVLAKEIFETYKDLLS